MVMIEVVAGLLIRDGDILIARRRRSDRHPALWEYPGGKREDGETPPQCLMREFAEELGVDIKVHERYDEVVHRYSYGLVHIAFYFVLLKDPHAVLKPQVHDAVRFVPFDALGKYPFLPADRALNRRLMAERPAGGPIQRDARGGDEEG